MQLRINRPPRSGGGISRRAGFRCQWGQPRGGSSPLLSTIFIHEMVSKPMQFRSSIILRGLLLVAFVMGLGAPVAAKTVRYPSLRTLRSGDQAQ